MSSGFDVMSKDSNLLDISESTGQRQTSQPDTRNLRFLVIET
jgi:hypothetical protein